MLDRVAYHGFPGGRPKWHFDLPSKPKPEPVTVPTGLHELAILRLVTEGMNTHRTIAAALGFKAVESVARHIKALDHGGYISRTSNNGRDVRIVSLTDKGRKALELARERVSKGVRRAPRMACDNGYDAWLVAAQPTPGAIEEPEHTEKRRVFQRAPRPVGSVRAVEQGEPV